MPSILLLPNRWLEPGRDSSLLSALEHSLVEGIRLDLGSIATRGAWHTRPGARDSLSHMSTGDEKFGKLWKHYVESLLSANEEVYLQIE